MPNISASMRDRILRTNPVSVVPTGNKPAPKPRWLLRKDWIVPMKLLRNQRKKLLRKIRAWTTDPYHPDLNSMIQRLAGLEKSLQEFDRRLHPNVYEEAERILQKRAKFMQMYGASTLPNLQQIPRRV